MINTTKAVRSANPGLTLLSNNYIVPYVMDVSPSGGPHFARLDTDKLKKYPECLILWDQFSSNPRFDQTELTKEKMLQDTTMVLLKRYTHWDAELLLFYRNTDVINVQKSRAENGFQVVAP